MCLLSGPLLECQLNHLDPGPEVIKLFSCSTHLSMKFQLLINLNCWKIPTFLAFKLSDVAFSMLINVKMPTIVGILTFMSMINFVLSWVEHEKSFIASGPGQDQHSPVWWCFREVHALYRKKKFERLSGDYKSWQISFVCLFCWFRSQVNSYGMAGRSVHLTTFPWAGLTKRLTSNLCTNFHL